MFWKKGGLRNFRREQTLEQKRLWNRCFPVNFRKFLRTLFLTEHLWWLPLHQFEIEKVGIGIFQIILWNFAVFLKSYRNSPPYVFWEKEVLKKCSKFTGEPPCRSVISIKLFCKFTEITVRHGCFPLNLLHIFRVPFLDHPWGNVSGINKVTQN